MNKKLYQQLKELTAIPSISCTLPQLDMSNLSVIELLAGWFDAAGFTCNIMPVGLGKANLIAVRGGSDASSNTVHNDGLVLAGHTDTVPMDEALWHSNPFHLHEADGKLYGLGISDMKGFFALILQALQAFEGKQFKAPLIIVATCDEETSMAGARALLKESLKGRFALIGEPTGLKPARMHKGVMLERVVITGQSGHSSDPDIGRNAIDAMTDVMGKLLDYRETLKVVRSPFFPVPYPTLNLGCIHGGDNPNRICGLCELQFDVRTLPNMNVLEIRQHIQQLLDDVSKKHGVDILYEPASTGVPAMITPEDSPFVKQLELLTGQSAGAVAFGTEAPFFRKMGMDAVVLGAGNIEQAHQPNEYLEIANINPMIQILEKLIDYYCVQGHAVQRET